MGYTMPPVDGLDALIQELRELARQVAELQRPDGSQTADAVQQLRDLVNGLLTQVNGIYSGYVQAGGNITTTAGYIFTAAGYAYDITYTRRAAWLGNDGRLGWASSSVTAKELLKGIAQPDALAILSITSHYYERKAERAKRDDPKSPEYRGPDYHVATEWGALAERLHDLGLWQVVIYDWEVEYQLEDVLDDDGMPILDSDGLVLKRRVGEPRRIGDPIPVGIHYELLGLLSIEATKFVWGYVQKLERRVDDLEQAQGL